MVKDVNVEYENALRETAQSVAMAIDAINALKNDIADIHKRLDALEGHTHGEAFGGSVF
jgi:hypothetical protein